MKSAGLAVGILVLAVGCVDVPNEDEGPDVCHYECTGNGCPELIVRDLDFLVRARGDGPDLYWVNGAGLYERDAQGGTTEYPSLGTYPTSLDIAGGQAWVTGNGQDSVRQLDLASWKLKEQPVLSQSLVAVDDGSAVMTSDGGLLRVTASGVSKLEPDIRGGEVGRWDDKLLVAHDGEIDSIDSDGNRARLLDVQGALFELAGFGDHVVFRDGSGVQVLTMPETTPVLWSTGEVRATVVAPTGVLWTQIMSDGRSELRARRWDEVAPRVIAWDVAPHGQTPIITLLDGYAVYGAGEMNRGQGFCALVKVPSGL